MDTHIQVLGRILTADSVELNSTRHVLMTRHTATKGKDKVVPVLSFN